MNEKLSSAGEAGLLKTEKESTPLRPFKPSGCADAAPLAGEAGMSALGATLRTGVSGARVTNERS